MKRPSSLKRVLFSVAAVLMPFFILILIEAAVRAGGVVSGRQNLFHEVPEIRQYVAVNPEFAGRYFYGFRPDVAPRPFLKSKTAGTRRIFVLGGSSAAGFPYHFYNGFPAYLEEMLKIAYPGQPVEVINLSMTAVNSFTLYDLHRRLLPFEPDAVLIYAGHNEYYGAYGAAVVRSWMKPLWVRRLLIRIQDIHLVSWLSGVMDAVWARTPSEGRTLMARMSEGRMVPLDSPRFDRGIRHFERNMGDIIRTFRDQSIPVYLSTVVSNKAGQQPLADDPAADSLFALAGAFRLREMPDSSRHFYRLAREHDPLRFRAPGAINAAIRSLGNGPGVYLVDAHAIVTSNNLPLPFDPSYFTDHLHLDYRGYGLVAEAFRKVMADSISSVGLLNHGRPDPLEEVLVNHTLELLMNDFPFEREEARRMPGQLRRQRLNRLCGSGLPEEMAACRYLAGKASLVEVLADLADHYRKAQSDLLAVRTLRALHYLQPLNPDLDDLAISYLTGMEAGRNEAESAAEFSERLLLLVRVAGAFHDSRMWPGIVGMLIRAEMFDLASRWLEAWDANRRDADYYLLQAQWHIRQGDIEGAQPWFREYFRQAR